MNSESNRGMQLIIIGIVIIKIKIIIKIIMTQIGNKALGSSRPWMNKWLKLDSDKVYFKLQDYLVLFVLILS